MRALAAIDPELVIKEGKPIEAISALIDEDRDIAILVLATGTGSDGPGPLVSSIAAKGGGFPIPSPSCPAISPTRTSPPSPEGGTMPFVTRS